MCPNKQALSAPAECCDGSAFHLLNAGRGEGKVLPTRDTEGSAARQQKTFPGLQMREVAQAINPDPGLSRHDRIAFEALVP